MTTPLTIEVRQLCHTYHGDITPLRGLDLQVRAGQRMAVLGANGSGKSTLFLHLNGTLRPGSGEILIDGVPVRYDRAGLRRWRARVGLVFQDPDDQVFAPTVAEDVAYGPCNLGLDSTETEARVEESLQLLDIADLRSRPPWTLSEGQKRRVAIAGVLAMQPRILILDEPATGLDHAATVRLLALLEVLHSRGVTIIMATHDIDLVATWADEVAIIESGRTVRQGAADEILTDRLALSAAGLPLPLPVEIAATLRAARLIPGDGPLPRSRATLIPLLEHLDWRYISNGGRN